MIVSFYFHIYPDGYMTCPVFHELEHKGGIKAYRIDVELPDRPSQADIIKAIPQQLSTHSDRLMRAAGQVT